MAKQSLETRLMRRKLINRRGVWTTWQSPGSWEASLLRADDAKEKLQACPTVGRIEADITADVLNNRYKSPGGSWAMLIQTKGSGWVHLANPYRADSAIRALHDEFSGEVLCTGHQDTAGVTYVRYWNEQSQLLEMVTDGCPWDDDLEEEDDPWEYTQFKNTGFDTRFNEEWFRNCGSAEAAHQELIVHLDAYVPGYWVDYETDELGAYHHDAVSADWIERIDLIHFGPQEEPQTAETSNRKSVDPQANEKLSEALDNDDLAGVTAALQSGASLLKLADGTVTPLAKACWNIEVSSKNSVAIIEALLVAGAAADFGGVKAKSPMEILLNNGKAFPQTIHDVIRALIKGGADVNRPSEYKYDKGSRPLHEAAAKGRVDLTILLLEAGADAKLKNAEKLTPRKYAERVYQGMKSQLGEEMLQDQHLDYPAVIDCLKQAEAGTVPDWKQAQPQIERLTEKAERHLKMMERFKKK